jgi:hypothetical protein
LELTFWYYEQCSIYKQAQYCLPWSLALSLLPLASPVSTLKGGESWADAKPKRVTSEKSFLSLAGGLVDGPALLPRASV